MAGPFDGEPERHPAFGMVQVNRVSSTGATLFDSELRHDHYVVLRVQRAARQRALHRDWIHAEGPLLVELSMSMAQWGALVSSFGTAGVPATIDVVDGEPQPEIPFEPRLATSTREVVGATDKLIAELESRVAALRDAHNAKAGRRDVEAALRDVEVALGNARPNARFAAQSFTEHVENVVTKARADIEATVAMAAEHQLDAGAAVRGILGAAPAPRPEPDRGPIPAEFEGDDEDEYR